MEYGILKDKKPEDIMLNYKEWFTDETINKWIAQYNAAEALRNSQK